MKALALSARSTLKARSVACCGIVIIAMVSARTGSAQSVPYQRTFPQSKAIVEKRLQGIAILRVLATCQLWRASPFPAIVLWIAFTVATINALLR